MIGLDLGMPALAIRRAPPATSSWELPGAAIDLDFAGSRYFGGSLASLVSCSRASSGYARKADGTLLGFGNNVLRITDEGLLIEEARTNLCLRSQDFGTTWSTSAGSNANDAATAPDGTATADQFSENGASSPTHGYAQTGIALAAATTYAFSVHLKYSGRRWIRLAPNGASTLTGNVWFDIQNGVAGASGLTTGSFVSSSVETLANGWYRVIFVATTTGAGSIAFRIFGAAADNDAGSYVGLNAPAFCAWGAQIEAGTFATSYIPTAAATATRDADIVSLAGAALTPLAAGEGSAFAQVSLPAFSASAHLIGGGGADDYILRQGATATEIASRVGNTTGGLAATIGGGGQFGQTLVKAVAAWNGAGRSLVANGGTLATDALAGSVLASGFIGCRTGGANISSGRIQRIALWSSRLSDAAMPALTA
jgi:hypothetical protein